MSMRLVKRSSGAREDHWRLACIRVVIRVFLSGAGLLLEPRPSSTAVDEGERPCVVGTGPGIKLLECSPSGPTELRQRAVPGSESVSRWGSRHDRDGLTAPTRRAPSTAAEGAWRIIRVQ